MTLSYKIAPLICLIFVAGVCGDAFDEIVGCSINLAERCFRGFFASIVSLSQEHIENNVTDICSLTYERITCATDVIDTDCNAQDGRDNFDNWIEGLKAVYNYLCLDSKHSLLDLFRTVDGSQCLDLEHYVRCIEENVRITHVVDLLHVSLDVNECNYILIYFTTCAANSINHDTKCDRQSIQHTLGEILQIFIQQTKCSSVLCSSTERFLGSYPVVFVLYLFNRLL